ncbi:glycoside hydrolase family 5 protein [Teredinibacter purpureus]|uniref:glycoside hydrolase family 5 protein n=1 Tax=Teredinibacter purpureus TaxID=2731756 RepID=UPI0005F8505C|nr:cellulase family glycosylhydrolase [Teredinibacter purpureus]
MKTLYTQLSATLRVTVSTLLLLFVAQLTTASPSTPAAAGEWWNQPYPSRFDSSTLNNPMSLIRVEGNAFVNEAGETVVFRGVNISDPDKLEQKGKWSKAHFEAVKAYGANVIRVPVHPVAWQKRGNNDYFTLLDQAVHWANELGMYLIIDWHSIGNLKTEMYQHPMYNTTLKETREFWRQVSFRYKGVPTIAVYELFNEPTLYSGQLGEASWDEWREINESLIKIIYSHDTDVIPLVAGFNWAYDLSEVRKKPIRAKGIAYAAHPYPTKSKKPAAEKPKDWEKTWGYVANKYPMIATELGWMRAGLPGAHIPVIDDGSYGPVIVDYLTQKNISWTVWCFDPDWPPQMISDWDYTPTEQGEFFRKVMLEQNQ